MIICLFLMCVLCAQISIFAHVFYNLVIISGHKGVELRRVHCPPEFLCRHGYFIFNIKIHLKESATHISRDTFNLKYLREQPTYVA